MRERGWGRIVNIGSINGQAGQYGQVNCAAAKSGIHGFTKALAQEGAKFGVTVNAIAPGYIDTDMVAAVPEPVLEKIVSRIPTGRLGHAEEIARGVAFLTAEEAGFVTGSTMSLNGGQHMYCEARMAGTRIETDTFGEIAVPAESPVGRADPAQRCENFRIGGERIPLPVVHALGRDQAGGGAGERPARPARREARRRDRGGGRRGRVGRARRAFPAGRVADRLGHPEQHERQRGDRQPRQPRARRASSAPRRRSIPTTTST